MKDQLQAIREALQIEVTACQYEHHPVPDHIAEALTALAQIEAAVREPVALVTDADVACFGKGAQGEIAALLHRQGKWCHPLFTVTPVAQQPRCPLCNYQYGHQIGCKNNPMDIALNARATQQPQADEATSAGLEASISILSQLVDEQRQLLAEVDAVFGVDAHGIVLEDGDSALIDRVRSHLAATNEAQQPQAEAAIDKCSECGKASTKDSMWALYCVECIETKIAPALAADQPPAATVQQRAEGGVEAHLHQYLPIGTKLFAAPQQAEAVPPDVVRDAERYRWLFSGHTDDELNADMLAGRQPVMTVQDQLIADFSAWYTLKETADAKIDAAIAQQKGQP